MRSPYCLGLLPAVWCRDIPRLAQTRAPGVARLTRNYTCGQRELLAHRLDALPAEGRGARFGPRTDLLLVQLDAAMAPEAARQMIARFGVLPTQLVVALALGTDRAAGQWVGVVCEGGRLVPLEQISLVGPGMLKICVEGPAPDPGPLDGELWSRTRGALGEATHRTVRQSSVAVIGLGRNGSACALTLAMLEVRHLVLIDHDLDELSNLDATVGATLGGIGKPKVNNRLRALRRVRPGGLTVTAVARSVLDADVLEHLRAVDLIVTAVDQDAARLAVARWINGPPHLGKVHLDIGTGVFRQGDRREMGADVRLFLPGQACVGCLGGLRNPDEARYLAAAPAGALPTQPRPAWHEGRAGSLITINQVAVNLGIQLWLDLLSGRVDESRWYQLRWADDGSPTIQPGGPPAARCEICRKAENL